MDRTDSAQLPAVGEFIRGQPPCVAASPADPCPIPERSCGVVVVAASPAESAARLWLARAPAEDRARTGSLLGTLTTYSSSLRLRFSFELSTIIGPSVARHRAETPIDGPLPAAACRCPLIWWYGGGVAAASTCVLLAQATGVPAGADACVGVAAVACRRRV